MRYQNQPKLTLVGAGPGDPDLITVKGLKTIADADVVLYDALVNTALLNYAPAGSLKIFAGKRAGRHSMIQKDINQMIVNMAYRHGHVVRLKGGDPFIFGRGFEELSHAVDHNIPVEVVPGISSSTGVPALQNLPLTLRGLSEGFWVITGTTSTKDLSRDIELASYASSTVVILMGMNKLSLITTCFKERGKGKIPVMIIQNGSISCEKAVTGTIDTIESLVIDEGISSPAVIIIGRVVKEADKFKVLNGELKNLYQLKKQKVKGGFTHIKLKEKKNEQFISRIS